MQRGLSSEIVPPATATDKLVNFPEEKRTFTVFSCSFIYKQREEHTLTGASSVPILPKARIGLSGTSFTRVRAQAGNVSSV